MNLSVNIAPFTRLFFSLAVSDSFRRLLGHVRLSCWLCYAASYYWMLFISFTVSYCWLPFLQHNPITLFNKSIAGNYSKLFDSILRSMIRSISNFLSQFHFPFRYILCCKNGWLCKSNITTLQLSGGLPLFHFRTLSRVLIFVLPRAVFVARWFPSAWVACYVAMLRFSECLFDRLLFRFAEFHFCNTTDNLVRKPIEGK